MYMLVHSLLLLGVAMSILRAREKSWYIMMFMNSVSNTVYYYTSRNWDWMIFFIQIYNVSILMAHISELSFYFWKMTFYMHSA